MKKNNDTKDSPNKIKNTKETNKKNKKVDNKKISNKKTNTKKIVKRNIKKDNKKENISIEKVDLNPIDKIVSRSNLLNAIRNKVKKFISKDLLKSISRRVISLVSIAVLTTSTITLAMSTKYKPLYIVRENDEVIGYVENKEEFIKRINDEILTKTDICAVSTTLKVEPTYELKFLEDVNENEDEIIERLRSESTTLYRVYAILINGEEKSYVKTWDEAENIVNQMNEEYNSLDNVTVSAIDKYTEDILSIGAVELADATTSIDSELRSIEAEQKRIAAATVNGVYLSVKPVTNCTITSRYGVFESSVRNHAHGGIDLAASYGTAIKAAAGGTIKLAEYYGGYGNLVVIDHGNGVETYYGHCSKIYVRVGQTVEAGDTIAAVGSTGNSTGNHCHFEVRVNGSTVNPQKYMYN